MRILLLSANTGEGHNSTGKAIMDVMNARGIECEMQDALCYLSPGISKFICGWHSRIYRHFGKLFDFGYRLMERTADPEDFNPVYEGLGLGARKLRDAINKGNYDAIVTVHPFTGSMLTVVRRNWGLKIPSYFVATDYSCCPTVEQCELDRYFIPAKELTAEFTRAGLSKIQLEASGIPVRQAFYSKTEKAEMRQKLDLPAKGIVALLMCGSMGCGPIQKVAEDLLVRLPEDATLIAVCGNNKRLYNSMQQIKNPHLRVLGFTKNIPEYMDAVDFIITKPGGLSSTEAANKGLPMVFLNTIGGCEQHNFDFFLAHGYAVGSNDPDKVVDCAAELAANPERLETMANKLRERFTVNSGQAIVDRVVRDIQAHKKKLSEAE